MVTFLFSSTFTKLRNVFSLSEHCLTLILASLVQHGRRSTLYWRMDDLVFFGFLSAKMMLDGQLFWALYLATILCT